MVSFRLEDLLNLAQWCCIFHCRMNVCIKLTNDCNYSRLIRWKTTSYKNRKVQSTQCLCSYGLRNQQMYRTVKTKPVHHTTTEPLIRLCRATPDEVLRLGSWGPMHHLLWDKVTTQGDSWQPNKKWHHIYLLIGPLTAPPSPFLFFSLSNTNTHRHTNWCTPHSSDLLKTH